MVEFQLNGMPPNRRFYWLVFDGTAVDICVKNPGHEIDLWVTGSMRTLVEIWLGHRSWSAAMSDESIQLDGSTKDCHVQYLVHWQSACKIWHIVSAA